MRHERSRPWPDELRARERTALNAVTLERQLALAVEEPVPFACECGAATCRARISLTPADLEAFRRNFRAFVVAPGHEAAAAGVESTAVR